jgi:diguanylate cyclase (GGDEF)-like protein/PAS domain S-box-containing protein
MGKRIDYREHQLRRFAEDSLDGASRSSDERTGLETKLERTLALVKATLESTTDGILVLDEEGRVDHFNERFTEMWRMPGSVAERRNSDETLAHIRSQLCDPGAYIVSQASERFGKSISNFFEALKLKDGRVFECYSAPQLTDNHHSKGRVLSFRDITVRRDQERKITHLTRIHSLLSQVNSAIIRVKEPLPLFEEVCKIAIDEGKFKLAWVGVQKEGAQRQLIAARGVDDVDIKSLARGAMSADHPAWRAIAEGRLIVRDSGDGTTPVTALQTPDACGSMAALPIATVQETSFALVLHSEDVSFFEKEQLTLLTRLASDIALALDYMEKDKKLAFLAYNDLVTGLPNRLLLNDRLNQAISSADRSGHSVALAFIDLDHFKFVNDTLGHSHGDRLLKEVATRLLMCVRDGDTVARLGGDEFVVVLPGQENPLYAQEIMQRALSSIINPYVIGGRNVHITCSIGLSFYPADGRDADTLLKNADVAMYRAKSQGRNNLQVYASEMNSEIHRRVGLESGLRNALEREEFELHYQPQIDLATGEIAGIEALIRWQHPDLGTVLPGEFIPLIETTDLILSVGEWVLKLACARNKALQEEGLRRVPIAINLAARQLRQKRMVTLVEEVLRETRLDPQFLEFELTESAVMENADDVLAKLQELRALGVKISLDDFGTGYSSLSYLKRFPIDVLKIDRAFIKDITAHAQDVAIAQTIIALGHNLGLKVIAEGVETQEQAKMLHKLGCDQVQGYAFGKPITFAELRQLLSKPAPFSRHISKAAGVKAVSC